MAPQTIINIICFLTDIAWFYTVVFFFDHFFLGRRLSKKMMALTCFGAAGIHTATILLFTEPLEALPIAVVLALFLINFCVSLCYRAPLKNRLIFSILIYALGALSEPVTYSLMCAYFEIDDPTMLGQPLYYIIYIILHQILFHIAVRTICRLFRKTSDTEIPFYYWLAIFTVPAGSIFLIFMLHVRNYYVDKEFVAVAAVVILLINILVFFLYDRIVRLTEIRTQNALLSLQNEYYSRQYKILEDTTAETRQLRHDLKGHLAAIKTYADKGGNQEISDYAENLLGKIDYSGSFSKCGILAIDGIVNLKMNEAVKLGVKTDVIVRVPADLIVNPVDITAVLSNILDNAVEACQFVEPKRRFIEVNIQYEKKNLFINVENSYDDTKIKNRNKKLLTTKQTADGETHGLGLDGIRRVLQKYDGDISIDTGPGRFSCIALLYSVENPK